jgi:methylated-DNA-[protein]-cysteine S-methyltransferase
LTLFPSAFIICPMILTPFETPMGWVAVLADDRALIRTILPQPSRHTALLQIQSHLNQVPIGENLVTRRARECLQRYFSGERESFDTLPIVESYGTDFQRRLWQLTRSIPYGGVRTYADLAQEAANLRAARAVGQCMARNPLPIVIPCHRVVGSDGSLRGFGGGLKMKYALLKMEGAL